MATNHELLDRKWVWPLSFEERLARKAEDDRNFGGSATLNQRNAHIKSKLDLPVWQHLGFGLVPNLRAQLDMGVDLAVDYFWGDWWTPQGLDRLMSAQQQQDCGLDDPVKRGVFLENNAKALDKTHPGRKLKWFTALQAGLFFGGLTGRWDDVARVCTWFDATIEPEYTAGTVEDEYFGLYLYVAGSLSPRPMDRVNELLDRVRKSRVKRPRLLAAAWEAVFAAEQSAFKKAFTESVKNLLSKPNTAKIAADWVALDQSIIWLAAEQRGLRFPAMPERHTAAIVTRQSLGLAN